MFEYFLGEFALAEGKQGGQLYTPRSIVELLVNMLEPYQGRVFDPCCGSGGMFVQSEKFVEEHQGRISDISIYGQESNQTTWRLAKMNLAIRGIDSSQVKWNNEGSFLNDAHQDLKADFIIANPPFNVSDWSGEQLRGDARWQYGALTSKTSGEGDIRKRLITDGNLIDCIVNLPAKLFLNTQIPAALWFMNRNRAGMDIGGHMGTTGGANDVRANNHLLPRHPRPHEILFIDARNLGHLINRRTRELSHDDIQKIADTYHAWRTADPSPSVGARCTRPDDAVDATGADAILPYGDVRGFCASVPISRVAELDYVLTPGRYAGLPDEEDDFNFPERFAALKAEFEAQLQEEEALNRAIVESLARVKV
ncbi:N-6 DNA methylase [Nitrosomonas oligotropha]|uniref:Type I restriction enzyme M protein n=1 Tax=Nitrosomonas oligotropha TaxID=42354 RepID=A0A1H8TVV8_9PROT|nr:N-6 DNA methylase [Nitrosomonas oligotropha]SDX35921.1 type I restriction enzyme M protein [Nitrosomonas oligotropha]SEO94558.1 type I restriction enzyme M protein [Nitrosomonas oligotropha]